MEIYLYVLSYSAYILKAPDFKDLKSKVTLIVFGVFVKVFLA